MVRLTAAPDSAGVFTALGYGVFRSSKRGRERHSIHVTQLNKGKRMKKWLLACLMCVAPLALADGHGDLGLEKRQPDAPMNVTSVVLGEEVSSISAEGDMAGYGKV